MSAKSVEDIKRHSTRLRGTLQQSLADPITGAIAEHDQTLIKFHGSYQQDDRDLREERRKQKLEPAYAFMIRTRTPGGIVSPAQWLKLDGIATIFAQRGLRITTRQAFQFHGVIKGNLKPTMKAINAAVIDTLAACGDVNRNIVVAANPHASSVHREVYLQASALSKHLLPHSRAYYEIWLDEEKVADSGEEAEPLYGATYLPRKFKIGFAVPPDNDVDIFAQDLGFIAIVDEVLPGKNELLGYNVSVGGGMGATHGDHETYPRLGTIIGFVLPEQVTAITEAVLTTQRDWGNRLVRKRARLKYTIDDRGVAAFKAEVERRSGIPLRPERTFAFAHNGDRFGWIRSEDHAWHLTLHIPAGRIWDRDGLSHLSGMRAIAQLLSATRADARSQPEFRLTANQNLVIANVDDAQRENIDRLVDAHGLDGYRRSTPARRNALACVAFPTCGLAMAEAERYLPEFLGRIEHLLERHGLQEKAINIRISGCPNGCSRPSLGEIALIGKAPGRYNLMLGADHRGQRLNVLHRENIDEQDILDVLDPLFELYSDQGEVNEGFGDFLVRTNTVRTSRPIHVEVLDAPA